MEGEKKRKRGENGELKIRDRLKKEGETVTERENNEAVVPQPSEEEVEEFFTILRRMNVAVKYFEKTGTSISDVNGGVDGLSNNLKAFEKAGTTVVDSVKIDEEKSLGIGNGRGLDLNAIPEAES